MNWNDFQIVGFIGYLYNFTFTFFISSMTFIGTYQFQKKNTILFWIGISSITDNSRTFHIIFFVLLWLDWGNESYFESFMMIISFMKPQLRSIVVLRRGKGGCHNQVMATHTIYYIARAICTLVLAIAVAVVNWFNLRDCHSLQFVTYAQHHCCLSSIYFV